jgi:PAS domain S-box-containing protein
MSFISEEKALASLDQKDLIQLVLKLRAQNRHIVAQQAQAIAEHQSNLMAVIENTDDYIVSVDTDYRILVCNSAYRWLIHELYEHDPQEGEHILGFMNPKVQEFWRPFYEKAFSGKADMAIVDRAINDQIRYYEVSFHPIKGLREAVTGATLFIKDITDRKLVEDTVRENQKMLASINRNIKEGIYRATEKDGLVYANDAFVNMFGYTSMEELLHSEVGQLYAEAATRDQLQSRIEKEGEFTNEEVVYLRKDGSRFYGMSSSIRWEDENGQVFYDGAVRDLTELIEAEHLLREQNKELKKVNAELDQFVYRTSHDLRAPLMSMAGLVNISRKAEDDSTRNYYLDLMETSINKLDLFIKDIIDFSKNARQEVKIHECELSVLLDEVVESLKPAAGQENFQLRLDVREHHPAYTDCHRLKVILRSLLSNAIRYQDADKAQHRIAVRLQVEKEWIHCEVKDNGIGIKAAYLDQVFDMFFRASSLSTGPGIGLYIAREATERLNGRITVHSVPGEGSTFSLKIPNCLHQKHRTPTSS